MYMSGKYFLLVQLAHHVVPFYALQKHVIEQSQSEDVCIAVQQHFYVDNWLQSFPAIEMAWRS